MSGRWISNRCNSLTALLAFPLLLAGCQNDAIDFNNDVAQLHQELGEAVGALGRTLSPISEGAVVPADEIKAAYATLLREFEAIQARSKSLHPPAVTGASELYEAHRRFLKHQQTLIEQDLQRIVHLATDDAANADKLYRTLLAEMQTLKKNEAGHRNSLHEAQQAFAKANGLRLGTFPR